MKDTLHLVLTYHWWDEIFAGRKTVEYREMKPSWRKLIWRKKQDLKHVVFQRGYTSTTLRFDIGKIDIGPCPYEGWDGLYYRIHFSNEGGVI